MSHPRWEEETAPIVIRREEMKQPDLIARHRLVGSDQAKLRSIPDDTCRRQRSSESTVARAGDDNACRHRPQNPARGEMGEDADCASAERSHLVRPIRTRVWHGSGRSALQRHLAHRAVINSRSCSSEGSISIPMMRSRSSLHFSSPTTSLPNALNFTAMSSSVIGSRGSPRGTSTRC